ncbi:hypothetical protein V2A60_000347 [Cordyceps javanica]|uniref:Phosphatidylserine decarboxylase family protein n=1 Tax=Cordyceps javanica TaxID=43265 RepID=A0A545W2U7_9HYPO|nr:phosphatidylserine decarboxylase family protein [Cordyceps javanica]TQW08254.1 phosphatidylserine decarboxylase family protein [Cordyceps javanica]
MTLKMICSTPQNSLHSSSPGVGTLSQHDEAVLWLQNLIRDVDSRACRGSGSLHPCVASLRDLIRGRAQLRMWASAMFEEVPNKIPYNRVDGAEPPRSPVRGYEHMLELLSVIVPEVAPTWSLAAAGIGLMGLPFQAVLDWPMGTPSGHAFFLDGEVNACFRAMLAAWRDGLLATGRSRGVLTTAPGHWLSPEAVAAMERDANLDPGRRYTFAQLFACDPDGDPAHWGFRSWDDFFTRRFRDVDRLRPVGYPDEPAWVVSPCEATPAAIKSEVREVDQFWLKGTGYSVSDMLGRHPWAGRFVGGTVHQSVLMTTSYHRWCAPVSGRVVHAAVLPGTYFSERSTNGLGSEPVLPPLYNLVYLSHVATRAVVFIEADGPVGLMCFLAIGVADVSSCEVLPKFMAGWPQPITKGEELGSFHYGGSSQCLLFRRGLKLAFAEGALPGNRNRNLAVRSPLAHAYV